MPGTNTPGSRSTSQEENLHFSDRKAHLKKRKVSVIYIPLFVTITKSECVVGYRESKIYPECVRNEPEAFWKGQT